jgi:SAM-dependent methyltransferase
MSPPRADAAELLHFTSNGTQHSLRRGEVSSAETFDVYRDAPASELREIVSEIDSGRPWREAVASRYAQTNGWLHRIVTDPSRDLFFRVHPPLPGGRILDIGAGWGQIALPLAHKGLVCALEPTPERLDFIRARARQEKLSERMWFLQADFFDLDFEDHFGLVTCIGVLEWLPKFRPQLDALEAQRQFLSKVHRILAPGGRLVIGIENRLGLKYLLGAPDDHLGHPGISTYEFALADQKWRALSGKPLRSVIHTRSELDSLLRDAGFSTRFFHCAFPDYKLPQAIIPWGSTTDEFLTKHFIPEHEGITGTKLQFQAELRSLYQSMAQLRIASDFAPSFYIVAEKSSAPSSRIP